MTIPAQQAVGLGCLVLTGSNNEQDIQRAYDLQANCYLEKPHDADGFGKLIEVLDRFWLRSATLPKRD